jgi:biopolymer transport protein TolQ
VIQGAPDSTARATQGFVDLILGAKIETQVVLVVCAIFSIISWYIIAIKWWEFRRLSAQRKAFRAAVHRARGMDEREQAMAGLGHSPFAEIVRCTMSFLKDLRGSMQKQGVDRTGLSLTQLEALSMTLETEVGKEVEAVGRMVPMLAVVASTAPLLGLLGTVLGIVNAFLSISAKGTGNVQAVAPSIADALIATAAGLAAAIPAVVAYNIFTSRAQRFEGELERLAQETIGALGREGRL